MIRVLLIMALALSVPGAPALAAAVHLLGPAAGAHHPSGCPHHAGRSTAVVKPPCHGPTGHEATASAGAKRVGCHTARATRDDSRRRRSGALSSPCRCRHRPGPTMVAIDDAIPRPVEHDVPVPIAERCEAPGAPVALRAGDPPDLPPPVRPS